jgi:hypothetical protein
MEQTAEQVASPQGASMILPEDGRAGGSGGCSPGGLPAQEHPPGGGHPPWRRIESVAAQRGADRGRGNGYAKPLELAF